MTPISAAAPILSPGVQAAQRSREARSAPEAAGTLKPLRDEYVPEENKRESYGRYWVGRDKDGSPKIYFDDPEAMEPAEASENPDGEEKEPAVPGKAAPEGKKEEKWRGSTDAVDREIKELKEKKAELEKRLSSETDEVKARELERKLSQVENELRQKDNDAYRRQHSTFTRIS